MFLCGIAELVLPREFLAKKPCLLGSALDMFEGCQQTWLFRVRRRRSSSWEQPEQGLLFREVKLGCTWAALGTLWILCKAPVSEAGHSLLGVLSGAQEISAKLDQLEQILTSLESLEILLPVGTVP